MQLKKCSKLKIFHTPGKKLSDADMLSRSFTKVELQINQLKHKQLPPQIDLVVLQDITPKPVHYVIKHEEVLPHQKMTLIQFSLIMVQIIFQYVSMIKETILLSNL